MASRLRRMAMFWLYGDSTDKTDTGAPVMYAPPASRESGKSLLIQYVLLYVLGFLSALLLALLLSLIHI